MSVVMLCGNCRAHQQQHARVVDGNLYDTEAIRVEIAPLSDVIMQLARFPPNFFIWGAPSMKFERTRSSS